MSLTLFASINLISEEYIKLIILAKKSGLSNFF